MVYEYIVVHREKRRDAFDYGLETLLTPTPLLMVAESPFDVEKVAIRALTLPECMDIRGVDVRVRAFVPFHDK